MKIPTPDLEPEFDEFGDKIIYPIETGRSPNGRTIYLKNMAEYSAYTKQVSRNRDAKMLENSEIDELGLRRKNGMVHGVDLSKMKIVAIGTRRYEDID